MSDPGGDVGDTGGPGEAATGDVGEGVATGDTGVSVGAVTGSDVTGQDLGELGNEQGDESDPISGLISLNDNFSGVDVGEIGQDDSDTDSSTISGSVSAVAAAIGNAISSAVNGIAAAVAGVVGAAIGTIGSVTGSGSASTSNNDVPVVDAVPSIVNSEQANISVSEVTVNESSQTLGEVVGEAVSTLGLSSSDSDVVGDAIISTITSLAISGDISDRQTVTSSLTTSVRSTLTSLGATVTPTITTTTTTGGVTTSTTSNLSTAARVLVGSGGFTEYKNTYKPNTSSVKDNGNNIVSLATYHASLPIGLYKIFVPPGTVNIDIGAVFFINASNATNPKATKAAASWKKAPTTPASDVTASTLQDPGLSFKTVLTGRELKFYSPPNSGVLSTFGKSEFNNPSHPTYFPPLQEGGYLYLNFLEAPGNVIGNIQIFIDVQKSTYQSWYSGARWDSNGNPTDGTQTSSGTGGVGSSLQPNVIDDASYVPVENFWLNKSWRDAFTPSSSNSFVRSQGRITGASAASAVTDKNILSIGFRVGDPSTGRRVTTFPLKFRVWLPPGTISFGMDFKLPQWVPWAISGKASSPPQRDKLLPGNNTWPKPPAPGAGSWSPGGEYETIQRSLSLNDIDLTGRMLKTSTEEIFLHAGGGVFGSGYTSFSTKGDDLQTIAGPNGRWLYFNKLEVNSNELLGIITFTWQVEEETYRAWLAQNTNFTSDGIPLGGTSFNSAASFTGFSSATGETLQDRLFFYGESKTEGLTFSQKTKATMDSLPDLAPNWAFKDIVNSEVKDYFKNPTANVIAGLESVVTSISTAANTNGKTSSESGDFFLSPGWERISVECGITLNASTQFSEHTDRIIKNSNENAEGPGRPTLKAGLAVGKAMTFIANQADSPRVTQSSLNLTTSQKYLISGGPGQNRSIEITDTRFGNNGLLPFLKNYYFLLLILGPNRVLGPYTRLDALSVNEQLPIDGSGVYSDVLKKTYQGFSVKSGKYATGLIKNVLKFEMQFNKDPLGLTISTFLPSTEPISSPSSLVNLTQLTRPSLPTGSTNTTIFGSFDLRNVFSFAGISEPSVTDPQAQVKFYNALLKYARAAYPAEEIYAIDKSIIFIDSIPYSELDASSPGGVKVIYSETGNPQIASGGVKDSRIATGSVSSLFVQDTIVKYRDELLPFVRQLSSSPAPTETVLNQIADKVKQVGDFLTNTRLQDEKFFENAVQILNEFDFVKVVAKPGETEKYLYQNLIGTEKLKKRLNLDYETSIPDGSPRSTLQYLTNTDFTPDEELNPTIPGIDDGGVINIGDGTGSNTGTGTGGGGTGGGTGGGGTGGGGNIRPDRPDRPDRDKEKDKNKNEYVIVYKPYPNIDFNDFRNSYVRLEFDPGQVETLAETPISVSDTEVDMDKPYNYNCCCINIFKCACEPPKRNKKIGFNLYTTEGVWVQKSFSVINTGTMDYVFDINKCYFENYLSFSQLTSKLNGFNPYDYGSTETQLVGITTANTGIIKAGETATVVFKTKKTTGVYGELNTESWLEMEKNVPDSTPYDYKSGVNSSTEKSKINLVIPFSYDPDVLAKISFTTDLTYGNEGSLFGAPTANTPAYWTLSEYSAYPKINAGKLYPVKVPISVGGYFGVKHTNNLRPVGLQKETRVVTISNTDSPYKFKEAKSDVLKNGRTINVTSIQVVSNAPSGWQVDLYDSSNNVITTPFTIQPYKDVLIYAKVNTTTNFVSSNSIFNPTTNVSLSPIVENGETIVTGATREVVKYKITTATGQESYFGVYLSSDDIVGEYEEVITYNKTVSVNTNFSISISDGKPDTKFKFVTDKTSKKYNLAANGTYTLANLQITSAGTYNYRFYFYGTDNERSIVITAS